MEFSFKGNLAFLVSIVIIVLNLAVYSGAKLILTDSFAQLESASVEENVQRAINAIENDLEDLGTLCTDWSVWDDTYDFIVDKNSEYIESNLVDSTFTELSLNAILFFDANGTLVFGRAMELAEEKEVNVPKTLLAEITRHQNRMQTIQKSGNLEGVFLLPEGPMFIAFRPILTSEGEGPARGFLVMARWLNQGVVTRLAERTELLLDIQPVSGTRRMEPLASGQKSTIKVDSEVADIIWGYSTLADIDEKPALILSIKMNRDVFSQGTKTISYFLKIFFLTSLLVGCALYVLILRNKERYDESERRFRYVFEDSTDGMFVAELNGKIKSINSAAKNLLGLKGPVSGCESIAPLSENKGFCALIRESLAGRAMGPAEFSIDDPVRKIKKHLQVHTAPLMGKKDKLIGSIVTIHDVTRQKEADLLKSEFIATAAHELKTPLASIMGFSEILLGNEGIDENVGKKYLSIIFEKSEALERIIDELLTLGKMETGGDIVLEKSSYDLRIHLDQLLASWRRTWQQHQIESQLPEGKIEIVADLRRINQVLDNLLGNAIKYSPDGGKVRVSGVLADGELEICVEDEGIGIRAEHLERVFDKFYRAENATSISGLGLGLNIAKNIIEKHGGRIWIESTLGQGTRVFFTLPCLEKIQ